MHSSLHFPSTDATLHRLDNGLEIILKEDHQAPLVSVQAWVRTGSLYEGRLLGSGVSHLVEHMVFKGAGHRGPTELARDVQDTGGYLNAYTSFDRTVYWVDTLADGFSTALDVVSALATEARFPEEEYEREKDVIRREMDMGKDDPGRTLSQLMFSTVFRQHPYREPVIGRLELFNQVTREQALTYYQERYVPSRMFLVIAGAITKERALEEVTARLGAKENRLGEMPLLPDEPGQSAKREEHIEFATELSKLELAWRIPDLLHPDTPALEVLGCLLGTGRSSRLYRRVREEKQLMHQISAGAYTPPHGGVFYAGGECDPDKRQAAEAALLEEITRIQQDGVAAAEVQKARRIFLSEQFGTLISTRGQASDLGSNWISTHNLNFTRDYLTAVDQVSPAQIQEVARRYLLDQNLSVVSLNPKGSIASKSVSISVGKSAAVERHELANGITVLVKEDHRLPMAHFYATFRGGLLSESEEMNGRGLLYARTVIKGAGARSAEQITEEIESVGGSVNGGSGGNSFSVSAGVLSPDFDLGLEIWSDCIRQPHFEAAAVAAEKERQLAAIKNEEDHMGFLAFRELRRKMYGNHPFARTRNGTKESVSALTEVTLQDFHASHVVGANAVVSIYGSVDSASLLGRLDATLGNLPRGERQIPHTLENLPESAGVICDLSKKDKRQAYLVTGFRTVDLKHPDRLALDLIDEACSDMASRLFIRIREEHGLAYSVGATQIIGMAPGAFVFHLSTAPEKLDFAQEQLLTEIALLAKDGLFADELNRARKTWIGKQAMQAQSNSSLAEQHAIDELYGLGWQHHETVLDRVRSISLDEVNAAAQRYFGTLQPCIVRVKGEA